MLYAAAGGAVFYLLKFPIPLLLGPMTGCLVAALAGFKMAGLGKISIIMRATLGVTVGSTITSEVLTEMNQQLASLAIVPFFLIVICSLGYLYFRLLGYDKYTSYYGSMPGGLVDMIIFGDAAGANVRALSLIHATRIILIFILVPFIIAIIWQIDLTRPPGLHFYEVPWTQLLLMALAGFAGWKVAEFLKITGGTIIGPMIFTAALTLTGMITFRPPVEFIWLAQYFIGIGVGIRYSGVTYSEIRNYIFAALGYCCVIGSVSIALALAIVGLMGTNPLDTLLAYLPGGQAEMAMVAIITDSNVAFVISHHILRLVLILLLSHWIAQKLLK